MILFTFKNGIEKLRNILLLVANRMSQTSKRCEEILELEADFTWILNDDKLCGFIPYLASEWNLTYNHFRPYQLY